MVDRSAWIALRAASRSGAFAHTSPVYAVVADEPPRSPEDARYFMAWIERLREDVRKRNQIPSSRWVRVEDQLSLALRYYQSQLAEPIQPVPTR
jgi:hypothetical protein